MKAYVKNGVVVATHDDWQSVPAEAYGDDVTVFSAPNTVKPGENISEFPNAEEVDGQ